MRETNRDMRIPRPDAMSLEMERTLRVKAMEGSEEAKTQLLNYLEWHIQKGVAAWLDRAHPDFEDTLQEARIKAITHLHTFEGRNNARITSWAFQIGRNEAGNRGRKEARRPTVALSQVVLDNLRDHGREFSNAEVHHVIHDVLRKIPERLRNELYMHYIQGMEYQEIADQRGIPMGTVKSRINRGKKIMLRHLADLKEDQNPD